MNSIQMLSSVLGLAFASGVNLYASVLVVGLGIRFGWLTGLPGDLNTLASPLVLIPASVMYFLEFFADKIPYVSVAWDSIHTFIRPLGGAALALASTAKLSPEVQALAMLAGGTVALGSHSTKMGYRMIAHASPEPVSDSVFSVAEDVGVVGLVLLTYQHPQIAAAVTAILILGIALVLPLILRLLNFAFHGVRGRLASFFLPGTLDLTEASLALPCFARRIPGVSGMRAGTLTLEPSGAHFAYRGWRSRVIPLEASGVLVKRGLLFDTVETEGWSVYVAKNSRASVAEGNGPLASSSRIATSSSSSSL